MFTKIYNSFDLRTMNDFLFSALACISTLIRNRDSGQECGLVILLTHSLMKGGGGGNLQEIPTLGQLTETFNGVARDIRTDYELVKNTIESAVDVSNFVLQYIHPYVTEILGNFPLKQLTAENDANSGWQNLEAPWTWHWIHLTTINIDLNSGSEEKTHFIEFVKNLVGCSMCQKHYEQNKTILTRALSQFSLTDSFLQLHTQTKINADGGVFVPSLNLINIEYKQMYEKKYAKFFANKINEFST